MEHKGHNYVPWRKVSGWKCVRCGRCCREYLVSVSYSEALMLSLKYSAPIIKIDNKYYLMPRIDGKCPFLTYIGPIAYCKIYYDRPTVCRLYPFYVSKTPTYGRASEAEFEYGDEILYVYVDSLCLGVNKAKNIREVAKFYIHLWSRYTRVF